jgi:hypothetical protein
VTQNLDQTGAQSAQPVVEVQAIQSTSSPNE